MSDVQVLRYRPALRSGARIETSSSSPTGEMVSVSPRSSERGAD